MILRFGHMGNKERFRFLQQRLVVFSTPIVTLEERVTWLETQVKAQGNKIKKITDGQLSLFDLAM